MNKYLPIGTVVLLKDGTKKLMVIGYGFSNDNKTFDYAGCLYPEGIFNLENLFAFDHEQISNVYYTGYIDEEGQEFQTKLKDIIYHFDAPASANNNPNPDLEVLNLDDK